MEEVQVNSIRYRNEEKDLLRNQERGRLAPFLEEVQHEHSRRRKHA